ncbi:alkyl hydroperoxide reductase [Aureimonas sp. Leaf454]|uniref:alkyl hydroperoxide reductase n=1 Tax=Aureimonas sp. Leaf454 TaxID=1736381 RepID=UPI0009E8B458|nr:alkyl hydroperoxide reductase [Aureimonas sp. Leaf454]
MTTTVSTLAPELAVSEWFNTLASLTLHALRGRPVLLHSFQLLCPGCVTGSLPQVQRLERVFDHTDLQVIGIHTVFEHHAAMTPVTLGAFLHEYRVRHPVGVDMADDPSGVPVTMRRFGWRGTPSSVLIGRDGTILHQTFGIEDAVGARIAMAIASSVSDPCRADPADEADCSSGRCPAPVASAA